MKVILIYRNIYEHFRTYRCDGCHVHVIVGMCPRFCPACGVRFDVWVDASIDRSEEPNRKWKPGEIEEKPHPQGEGCGLADAPIDTSADVTLKMSARFGKASKGNLGKIEKRRKK